MTRHGLATSLGYSAWCALLWGAYLNYPLQDLLHLVALESLRPRHLVIFSGGPGDKKKKKKKTSATVLSRGARQPDRQAICSHAWCCSSNTREVDLFSNPSTGPAPPLGKPRPPMTAEHARLVERIEYPNGVNK